MKKTIKFRAWTDTGTTKYFVHFSLMGEGNDRDMFVEDEPDETGGCLTAFKEDVVDIQQYTGLKDKNGKEIYEGDIVEWPNDEYEDREVIAGEGWVKFNPKYHRFDIGWMSELDAEFQGTRELLPRVAPSVIGNIYENPELLKNLA